MKFCKIIEDELGFDFGEYIQGVTIFGGSFPNHGDSLKNGAVVLHGTINEAAQQKLLAKIELEGANVTVHATFGSHLNKQKFLKKWWTVLSNQS